MRQIDAYVGRCLAGLTFPTDGSSGRCPFDPADLVATTCPMPTLKCLTMHAAPTPQLPADCTHPGATAAGASSAGAAGGTLSGGAARPVGWDVLVADMVNRVSRYDLLDRPVLSLASQAIARGVGHDPPPFQDERSQNRLTTLLGLSPCTPHPIDWKLSQSAATALPAAGAPRTLTLVSNRSTAGPQLEQILIRARLQLLGKAYVHHFERYGVGTDFINERAEIVQQVVDDYEGARGAFGGARRGPPQSDSPGLAPCPPTGGSSFSQRASGSGVLSPPISSATAVQ